MLVINSFLAFCVIVVLVLVVTAAITLLLRKRFDVAFVVLTTSALMLSGLITALLQPIFEEDRRHCLSGTQEHQLACRADRRAKGYSPRLSLILATVAIPTAIGVAGSMTILSIGDWRKRAKRTGD